MICFGAKTDHEVKEKGTCGSHYKNKKIKKNKTKRFKTKKQTVDREQRGKEREILFIYFLLLLSSIYGNRTVGIRRAKKEKCSTRRGLCVSTKNKGFC